MNDTPQYPREDVTEVARFKKMIKNQFMAMDVQLPEDMNWVKPHKEFNQYDLHITEPTGQTIINTFYFQTKEALIDAVEHTKALLPDEPENSETVEEDTQATGDIPEGSEESVEPDAVGQESPTAPEA